jgi:hypothetical protein
MRAETPRIRIITATKPWRTDLDARATIRERIFLLIHDPSAQRRSRVPPADHAEYGLLRRAETSQLCINNWPESLQIDRSHSAVCDRGVDRRIGYRRSQYRRKIPAS